MIFQWKKMQLNKRKLNRNAACAKVEISKELNYKRDNLNKI